jgi:membrane-bound lytic murein transglycosylase F
MAVIAETPAHDIARDLTGSTPSLVLEVLPHEADPEALLKALDNKQADVALVDTFAFAVAKRLHPDLSAAFNVGREAKVAWAFSNAADFDLQQSAVRFFEKIRTTGALNRLMDRYYGHINRIQPIDSEVLLEKAQTELPKLRPFFHEAQQVSGVEWRILAAVGYQESHWDPLATSPTGVRGLMMLTEDTADRIKVQNRLDARQSIIGGAKYISLLRDTVPARIPEPDRTWLALAAYNQGYGHLEDARILTARLGLNADSWLDVRKAYPKLREPEHYETLKHGFCRGDEAVQFVENIRNYTDILNRLEKPHESDLSGDSKLDKLDEAAQAFERRKARR